MKKRTTVAALALVVALLVQCACCAGLAAAEERTLTDLPTQWDLTGLYADEAAFEADMKRADELLPGIESLRGTLHSVEGLLNYLENPDLLEIEAIRDRAWLYSMCLTSLNASDAWAGKTKSRCEELDQKISIACAFVPSEIMELPLEERLELLSDERLAPYAHHLRQYADPDNVVLGEEGKRVEALFESAATNALNTYTIFDCVELPLPSITYPDGTEGTLTEDAYWQITQDSGYDHEFRKQALTLRNGTRAPFVNTYASLLEGMMRYHWAKAQTKGFDSTLAAALHEYAIEPEIYDRIIAFGHSLQPKVHEYYAAKKALLGLDEMMKCDLSVSVTDYQPKKISYEEAMNAGRAVISVWGDEYLETFDRIVKSGRIDVYPSDTKDSGAYMGNAGNGEAPLAVHESPFVLYNFDGYESYTSSLLHEMGHAVYGELSVENQNVYNNDPTIFTHEVASTANEIMFQRQKIAQASTQAEKLYWMDQEIELFLTALLTQCMYSEFEDYCYKVIEGGGALNAGDMAEKWVALTREYYGDALTISEEEGCDWARITHFYYDYYVYQYATSLTYATSICQLVEEKGQEAVDAYLDFLKAGNSASPSALLRIAGVDPLKDETYETAGTLIEELIDEFIATANEAA